LHIANAVHLYASALIASTGRATSGEKSSYNLFMQQIAIFAMRVLEVMFFVGLAGSTIVVLISFAEDGKELFGKDEPPESRAG
jgi:cytochrome c biogenesis protein CcdA